MSVSTVLAKALFDNTAESPEELAFRKGDILMVLEQEQSGGPGWWLCSLHGRQGIAPANRLRLLQTAPPQSADAAYLTPGPPLTRSAEDLDGVYRAPPGGAAVPARHEELRRADGGRPRSHSSSGTRPRPDWDLGAVGRPRSPSLRGRGSEMSAGVYQSPVSPVPALPLRPPGSGPSAEPVYLAPTGPHRPEAGDANPRETADPPEDCYLVPKGTPLASEGVYQAPTSGAALEAAGMYHTPSAPASNHTPPTATVPASPRPPLHTPPARGRAGPAHRASPLLIRAGQGRVPASPHFARKPPPPAPPVRGVTRRDAAPPALTPPTLTPSCDSHPLPGPDPAPTQKGTGDGPRNGLDQTRRGPELTEEHQDQVYDTPPSARWQRRVPDGGEDDGIYDTPRSVPPQDPETEVYDVPAITVNACASEPALNGCDADDEVYSVPTLPGLPPGPGESTSSLLSEEGAGEPEASEPDGGIYDMPALVADAPPLSSSSSSTSTRRLSVSSNGSGDAPWRASLCGLVHAVLSSASVLSARDLATSLAEILSTWKASHAGDPPPPPLQQAWARLSDLLPALAAIGAAPPSEGLLALVHRSLEESSMLLQAQSRPRLPSQESLSRRPLPALPVADGKAPGGGGMGSRKGSWIQERPLPPTPQPAFPLPPAATTVTMILGSGQDDDPSNEYAGIGLTPVPVAVPTGDSVGYVKLQGKPEPPPMGLAQTGPTITAEPRLSPSPPLPVSLSLEDSELLSFYSSQSLAHLSCLADAIDVLFTSVQGNQPPRVFVARGKSLIVTAHKLVFIGDTLSRLLTSADLRAKITTSGGRLCQALKSVVVATKGAAQNYPSVSATQEMVDRVAELSQQAAGFSTLLQRLAEIAS